MPLPFAGSASVCGLTGTGTPKSGVFTVACRTAACNARHQDARRARRRPGSARAASSRFRRSRLPRAQSRAREREPDAVIRAWLLAVFELGLRDRRAEVDVPKRGRLELVGEAALQQAEKRRAGTRAATRRRSWRRSATSPPTARDGARDVRTPSRLRPSAGCTARRSSAARPRSAACPASPAAVKCRVVRQRRIAADAVVILHAALGRQAVVVPPHRVEHRLAAHPLEARNEVGVRVREDVADVQRAADGRRRRVDRVDLSARVDSGRTGRSLRPPTVPSIWLRDLRGPAFRAANRVGTDPERQ